MDKTDKRLKEWRAFTVVDPRIALVRAEQESQEDRIIIEGYAAVFNSETNIAGFFREVIKPGAFSKTIRERDQVALWNHDDGKPLARRSAGTLRLTEDANGLLSSIEPGNTSWGMDAVEAIRRGDVQGMSFAFEVMGETWVHSDGNDLSLREITEARLYEVSPVTFPQYEETSVYLRSQGEKIWQRVAAEDQHHAEPEAPSAGNHSRKVAELKARFDFAKQLAIQPY